MKKLASILALAVFLAPLAQADTALTREAIEQKDKKIADLKYERKLSKVLGEKVNPGIMAAGSALAGTTAVYIIAKTTRGGVIAAAPLIGLGAAFGASAYRLHVTAAARTEALEADLIKAEGERTQLENELVMEETLEAATKNLEELE